MQLSDFDYALPEELIARYPMPERTASRLLTLSIASGEIQHQHFYDLIDFLHPDDLLVFNDTRVIPARLFGHKATGGKVEILVERILPDQRILAHVRASKTPLVGTLIHLDQSINLIMEDRADDLFILRFDTDLPVLTILAQVGHLPLPPYMNRADEIMDQERYQTVYAVNQGSVAAPTAGLHFDEALLAKIQAKGIDAAKVTLHVGAGTFQPVRVTDITQHKMHSEWVEVSATVCEKIRQAKARNGRVIAVGTTSVRSLETASQSGTIQPYCGETAIFIYPGYQFQCIDGLITNFHLPQSSLLMLVSAFAGYENTRHAYQTAIKERYRFFSYGDAMFIR